MNITNNPLDLKLSATQIGWADSKGRRIYISNEVPGLIQVRIGANAIWIPEDTLQQMLDELVNSEQRCLLITTCLNTRSEKNRSAGIQDLHQEQLSGSADLADLKHQSENWALRSIETI